MTGPRGPVIGFEVPADFDGDVTRAAFPRQLITYEEKTNKWSPCTDEDILASVEYLAVSYRQKDFPDRNKLEETIHEICHFYELTAFWLDYACTGVTQEEKNRDLYRIADVFRGATKTLILICGDDDRPLSVGWISWGDRIWTLPEALLSQELIYKVGTRPLRKVNLRRVANLAYKDRNEEMMLIDGYSGKEPLPLKERLNLLRKAIWKRSSGPKKKTEMAGVFTAYPGERVYALMGFMPHRIMPNSDESEETAFSRLIEVNGLGSNTIDTDKALRRAEVIPSVEDDGVDNLTSKLESQRLTANKPGTSVESRLVSKSPSERPKFRSRTPIAIQDDNLAKSTETSSALRPPHSGTTSTADARARSPKILTEARNDENSEMDSSISNARKKLAQFAIVHPDRPRQLCTLSQLLHRRYKQSNDLDDLDAAIDAARESLRMVPEGSTDTPALLTLALTCLKSRYDEINIASNDITEVLKIVSRTVSVTDDGHPYAASYLNDLAFCVLTRFWQAHSFTDLNFAITCVEGSLKVISDGNSRKAGYCFTLGYLFFLRFSTLKNPGDLNEAMANTAIAITLVRNDYPEKAEYQSFLGCLYGQRFELTKSLEDLDYAIELAEESIRLTPDDPVGMPERRCELGLYRRERHFVTGDSKDIELSIINGEKSVLLASDTHPRRAEFFFSYGCSLVMRANHRNPSVDEVNPAIKVLEIAISLLPDEQHTRKRKATYCATLFPLYRVRYEDSKNIADLNLSILFGQVAVVSGPIDDQITKAISFGELGVALGCRAEVNADVNDIQQAMQCINANLVILPDTHEKKPYYLYMAGHIMVLRFDQLSNPSDLDLAIVNGEKAVRLAPNDHTDKRKYLKFLAEMLQRRYSLSGNPLDYHQAVAYDSAAG